MKLSANFQLTNIEVINNFLDVESFKNLQNLILDSNFPWRIRKNMAKNDKNIYFTYSFFNENRINSELYDQYMIPFLKKLNCKALIEIRSNMLINKLFEKSGWHIDNFYESTTAILYLNTCNGGTEFKINNEIKFVNAEENKIVIFPSSIEHRACTSTDVDERYIINLNYF